MCSTLLWFSYSPSSLHQSSRATIIFGFQISRKCLGMSNTMQGYQNVQSPWNSTGFSQVISWIIKVPAISQCSHRSSLLCLSKHHSQHLADSEKAPEVPQWNQWVVMVTDKAVQYHSPHLWKDQDKTMNHHMHVCTAAESPAAEMHRILEREKYHIDLWEWHLLNLFMRHIHLHLFTYEKIPVKNGLASAAKEEHSVLLYV